MAIILSHHERRVPRPVSVPSPVPRVVPPHPPHPPPAEGCCGHQGPVVESLLQRGLPHLVCQCFNFVSLLLLALPSAMIWSRPGTRKTTHQVLWSGMWPELEASSWDEKHKPHLTRTATPWPSSLLPGGNTVMLPDLTTFFKGSKPWFLFEIFWILNFGNEPIQK